MPGSAERPTPVQTSKEFFQRLNPEDAKTIRSIIETIRQMAEKYDHDNEFVPGVYGASGFFGVYAIGGLVTKEGERPDVDLLIVTNARWDKSYRPKRRDIFAGEPITLSGDWVAGSLLDAFEEKGYSVELLDKIPNEYEDVGAKPKTMLRLTPKPELGKRKPIDIIYVKTTFIRDIANLSDFEGTDMNEDGKPLARITLLQMEDLGKVIQLQD